MCTLVIQNEKIYYPRDLVQDDFIENPVALVKKSQPFFLYT